MSTAATAIAPETLLTLRTMMVENLRSEFATTKKVLACLKDGEWKPDPHARTGPEIAWHLVDSEIWFLDGIADQSFGPYGQRPQPANVAEILYWYEQQFPRAIERIEKLDATQLSAILDFFGMKMPAYALLNFDLVHTVHHRGQLATYLRPLGGRCPDIYGGSYDEPWQGGQ